MTTEFRSALDGLASLRGTPDRAMLERFSSIGGQDVTLFRERFPLLDDALREALVAGMVESAEADFELDFTSLFRIALDDALPAVRRQAIEGLWEDDRLDLLRKLLTMLEADPSDDVRAAAATSLGRYVYMAECDDLDAVRGQRVRDALERALGQSLAVARRALESLAYINDEAITRHIDRAYAHASPLMRQSAVFAMGRSADRFWAETVLAELHSDDPAMRYEAARASGEMRLARALPVLVRLISGDRDAEVQAMAVWALGEIGGKRARQFLERLAESEDEALSAAASEALESMALAYPEFDMLIIEDEDGPHGHVPLEREAVVDQTGDDEDNEAEEEPSLLQYRRQFELYTDEDETSDDEPGEDEDDDQDWPDELLALE